MPLEPLAIRARTPKKPSDGLNGCCATSVPFGNNAIGDRVTSLNTLLEDLFANTRWPFSTHRLASDGIGGTVIECDSCFRGVQNSDRRDIQEPGTFRSRPAHLYQCAVHDIKGGTSHLGRPSLGGKSASTVCDC